MKQTCVLVPFRPTQASLKKLISMGRNLEAVEESISSMITQLIKRMCTPFKRNGNLIKITVLTLFFFLVIISNICFGVFTICGRGETTRNKCWVLCPTFDP